MKKNICLPFLTFLLVFFVFANASAVEEVYDGTQDSIQEGDALVFDGQSPYNDIANNINSSSSLTGTVYVTGKIDSYKLIFANDLMISSNGKITVDLTQGASSVLLMASKTVSNDGVFTIVGDGSSLADSINDTEFSGKGKIILSDSALNLINTVSIEQSSLTINSGKLTSKADLLEVKHIENHDTLTLTGGTFTGELSGNGTLNVNALASEKTVFVNSVLANKINLNFGTLKLSSYEAENATSTYGQIGSAAQRTGFAMQNDSVFDMANGRADDIVYVDAFSADGLVKIKADFDLDAELSDKINANSFFGSGNIDLSGLNIISDFNSIGYSTSIALFEGVVPSANIATIDAVYYKYLLNEGVLQVSGSYHITNSADSLGLNFTLLSYESDPFQAAVKAYGERMIRVESDYNISQSYDNIVSTGIFTLTGGIDGVSVVGSSENPKSIFVLQDAAAALKVQDITLKNGYNDNFAGAVYNEGNLFLSNAVFDANSVNASSDGADSFSYGGAVYNTAFIGVSSAHFKNNSASSSAKETFSSYAYGGAVYITSSSNATFENAVFEKNSAQAGGLATNNHYAYGGAIYIDSDCAKTVNIINSVFKENVVSAGMSLPETNEARAYGGAIYNGSGNILNVKNSSFSSNRADANIFGQSYGGAIYNAGVLNLIADGGNVEFSNNRDSAVYNSSSAYLNANVGDRIIFGDNESIDGQNGRLHVNKTDEGLPYGGDVEVYSVYGNDIFLYAGTLKIGGQIGRQQTDMRGNFTVSSGAVIDMINGKGDSVLYFNEFYMPDSEEIVLKIDVDLAAGRYDKIDISSMAFGTGKFDLSQLTITNEFASGWSLDAKILVNSSTQTFTNDYILISSFSIYRYHNVDVTSSVYKVEHTGDYGTLNISLIGYSSDTFQAAISKDNARSVQLESGYFAVEGFSPVLADGELTVNVSTNITINANEVSNAFKLDSNAQTLKLNGSTTAVISIINGKAELGGAIYNSGGAIIKGTIFDSNIAVAVSTITPVGGGAIYNKSEISIEDAKFKNNEAQGEGSVGGAIFNDGGIVNIVAQTADVLFEGNKANGVSNALHAKDGAIYNLNAGTYSVVLNDAVTSSGDNNEINVNLSSGSFPTYGNIIINANMSGFSNSSGTNNSVNVYAGSVKLGENAKFFTDVAFNMRDGATLDMSNSKIDNISLNGFNFNGRPSLIIDADLKNKQTDSLLGSKLAGGSSGNLVIENIVIWKDLQNLSETVYAPFTDDEDLFNSLTISEKAKKTLGPIFIYDVSLSGGNLVFKYANDYNPSIFIAPVTMLTGGYLGQINSYRQAFETVDNSYEKGSGNGLWVRPYAFSENIKLNGSLDVENEGLGAYFGYDGKITEIYSYTMNFSIYGAYNTLRQTYTGTEINQGGGMIGATAVLYLDNFFAALTANMGLISEHGQGPSGKDNFMMYTKGAALKGGYNIFFSDDVWQLQPSLSFSMTAVDMAPYSNSEGVRVSCEKFFPFHIEPGIKLISNAFETFKLYVDASFAIGLFSATEFSANDITLPEFSIDPYLQYSVGGYKNISDNFSAGGELFGRSGGRSGFGGQLTLKLKL